MLLTGADAAAGDWLQMRVRVRNDGEVSGAEVAQLYVVFPAAAAEPDLLLRGFQKTRVLGPGDSTTVEFRLLVAKQLAVWHGAIDTSDETAGWRRVPGSYSAVVGASSRDVRLQHSFEL